MARIESTMTGNALDIWYRLDGLDDNRGACRNRRVRFAGRSDCDDRNGAAGVATYEGRRAASSHGYFAVQRSL
jgi:hypothetical protein